MKHNKEHQFIYSLQDLAERTDKVVFVFVPKTQTFKYINPAFEQVVHKTRESVQTHPRSLLEIVHEEDKEYVIQRYHQLIKKQKCENMEFRLQLHGEKIKWVRLTPHLIEDGADGLEISGFVEDITIAKHHTSSMHKFAARKDSVLEILAHDLAGPHTNIRGYSTIMANKLKEYDDPELEELLNKIFETNERSIRMIREFVKEEFLQSVNSELIRKRVDLVQIIREVIDQYIESQEDIKKTFKLNSNKEVIFVDIDDFKFSQAINNLISNAIKFTPDGGNIAVDIEEAGEKVHIKISDDGIGIPEHLQPNLFEKFSKARREGLKGEPSVGLGMSIIKTIIEWHNGDISFESKEGEGTTFYIELEGIKSNSNFPE